MNTSYGHKFISILIGSSVLVLSLLMMVVFNIAVYENPGVLVVPAVMIGVPAIAAGIWHLLEKRK